MTIQYSGAGRERLIQAVAATSDANGAITFRVGPCPLGFVWQGSATVTSAPSGALFTSSVGSSPWGQHAGSTNFGPVQLWGNETLIMTGAGLEKNKQYSLLFVGVAMPEHLADPLPPVAPLSTVSVETSTLLVNGAAAVGATAVTIRPPSLTRRLTVVVASGSLSNTLIALIGTTSGANYGSGTFNSVDGPDVFYFAIEPTVDAAYTLSFSGTVAATYWVTANTTSPLVETDAAHPLVIAQPVAVTGPFGGPVSVSGSPVGPFNDYTSIAPGAGTVTIIPSPGAGQSIYLQSISGFSVAGAGDSVLWQDTAGIVFHGMQFPGGVASPTQSLAYPGGLEIVANQGVQVVVGAGPARLSATWTTGPTV